MNRFLVFLAALLLAAPVLAKGDVKAASAPLAPPTLSVINGNPLTINVASDNSYQIFNSNVGSAGQIFPSSQTTTADMGWFVDINGTLYSPNFSEHGGTATGGLGTYIPFGEISMTPVSGTGTPTSPFTVTVSVNLGDSGFRATKTTTYINGHGYFSERVRVVSKQELSDYIYPHDQDRDSNVLEVLVGRLRRKLDPDGTLHPIETLRGRGYRFTLS